MTLVVDFNRMNQKGFLPAIVSEGDLWKYPEGMKVVATDGEGTECWAEIAEKINGPRGSYVLLSPIDGTWNYDAVSQIDEGFLAPS